MPAVGAAGRICTVLHLLPHVTHRRRSPPPLAVGVWASWRKAAGRVVAHLPMERQTGLEPAAPGLEGRCSPIELLTHKPRRA